jgi:hypothetical protein
MPDPNPDSPILALLSLRHNPRVADMTTEELIAQRDRLKTLVQQPVSLMSALASEGKPKSASIKAKRQSILDSL